MVKIDEKTDDHFELEANRKKYLFKTTYRAQLMCQLFECIDKESIIRTSEHSKLFTHSGPFNAQRVRKNNTCIDCKLCLYSYGLIELDPHLQLFQEYKWVNINRIGTDESAKALFFESSGRTKIFYFAELDLMINGIQEQVW